MNRSNSKIETNWKKSAKSANQKLDIVLKALDHEGTQPETYEVIIGKDAIKNVSITMRELHQIIQKLQGDKYVDDTSNQANTGIGTASTYYITIEGEFFIQSGGYVKRAQNEKRAKIWNILQIVAIAINGLVLLFLSILTYMKSDESEDLNIKLNSKDAIIHMQEQKLQRADSIMQWQSAVISKLDVIK